VEKELFVLPFSESRVPHPPTNHPRDEQAQNYAYAVLLHVAIENKRADQAIKCVSASRPDCATAASDILCERLDGPSFARSLSLMDNLMFRHRLGESLTEYVR
jgi:hypothetical protein